MTCAASIGGSLITMNSYPNFRATTFGLIKMIYQHKHDTAFRCVAQM